MSWMALSGSVLTYGDAMDDLPDEYMKVYKQMKMYNDDELNPVLRGQK